ncbi:MAG: type II toxin-antitoxin system Phd/YefM family antitoxin [Chloroflexota bacterium]
MDSVNLHHAKTQLSRLLERVEQREEIVIARNGRPVAQLAPMHQEPRMPGRLKGLIVVRDIFDDPLSDDIISFFSGETANEAAA